MIEGEKLKRVRLYWLTRQQIPIETPMTCDTCEENHKCPSAFDAYNTDGDCLESK
jgi:hypothetical protein